MRNRDSLARIHTRLVGAFLALGPGWTACVSLAHASVASPDRALDRMVTADAPVIMQDVMGRDGQCEPQWVAGEFCAAGLDGTVYAAVSWDDGTGEALYVGGAFSVAECATIANIARWDGSKWSALSSGMNGSVRALVVFDDGSGPGLYAGGAFTTAGGRVTNRIARWDGSTWSPLGSGMNGTIHALAAYDDGEGAALYAGGGFTTAGGSTSAYFAKWQGCPTGSTCAPDLTGDALLNFFDIATFLNLYQTQAPIADWNADGLFNFFDLASYLNAFNAGCP